MGQGQSSKESQSVQKRRYVRLAISQGNKDISKVILVPQLSAEISGLPALIGLHNTIRLS